MSAVSEALIEVEAALAAIAPAHEGLRDYAMLDILPETQAAISPIILEYDQRRDLLLAAKAALEALINDEHPVVPVVTIPEAAYEDLEANFVTVQAALAAVAPQAQAGSLGLSGGAPQPK